MGRPTSPSAGARYQAPLITTVDLRGWWDFPGRSVRGAFQRELSREVAAFPDGRQQPWGIPFDLAGARARARVILVTAGRQVRIPVSARAAYLCVLHVFRKSPDDPTGYVEAQPVAEYEIVYARGASHVAPVRARLEVEVPESPGPAQLAVPFTMPTTTDPEAVPPPAAWGRLQFGVAGGPGQPLLYALRNPRPRAEIEALVIRGLSPSPLLVAGLTCYTGSDHPLRHLARRYYRVTTAAGEPAQVAELQVQLGAVARADRTTGPRGAAWLKAPYAGADEADEAPAAGETIYSIYGAADAVVTAKAKGRSRPARLSLGEAYTHGRSARDGLVLERLGGRKQWMEVEIIDASTGKPTPVRLHLSGARGEYLPPYGHHEQVNANWFEDYGADLRVSGRQYAYVPGRFTTDLPTGPLYVEMTKGFEYRPTRLRVNVQPGQRQLRLTIERYRDWRSQGWVTADTHVHFLSPQTAWLEAQGEGINVVNLLASQWGRLFTNVGDISGRVGVVEDDTVVWVGTENRNHMLGHISLLGTQGQPVYPMCCGGVFEAWVGDPEYRALSEWAQECRAKGGVVIRPHFPYCGFTEDPVLAVKGAVDALEIHQSRGGGFPLQEWYRYLNNGYRVAVAGGTDKMGAYRALGSLRTYAKLDPSEQFTYESWARAMRAGRSISTNGPLLDLQVEGRQIGDSILLPAGGGTLEVQALAESAWQVGTLEIVHNGRVVAQERARRGAESLRLTARVAVKGPGWIAARCAGAPALPSQYMAAHTSPVYLQCNGETAYDGPALQHMLNLTRGGAEYLATLATRFSEGDHERIIGVYREVEEHLRRRLEQGR
ncbi:MAG: CehA/McbA family metallohydrolase [Candidatus Latescibacterota bacterium]|jgi:hypothetical protein